MLKARERRDLAADLAQAQHRIAQLEAESIERARRDPLTGMLSPGVFRGQLVSEVTRARRYGRPLVLALLALDDLRGLEGRVGFQGGDELIGALAPVVSRFTRISDVVGRTGRDEFAILMPETDLRQAHASFQRLLLELEVIETARVRGVSASIGITALAAGQSAEGLLDAAARALGRAHAAGGARAEVYEPAGEVAGDDGSHRGAVEALSATLLERDPYTSQHSESVVALVDAVDRLLGLSASESAHVRLAALLHDVGKVAIPDEILHKPGPLDDREWELMREHPVIGERILRSIPGLGPVARIVRHEHERWDGAGYPDGLKGVEIPIGSRIILACDAYHAMTSDRPYRAAMAHADAVDQLARAAGSQFDPDVTGALIGHVYGRRQGGGALSGAPRA